MTDSQRTFSYGRLCFLLIPLILVAVIGVLVLKNQRELATKAKQASTYNTVSRLLSTANANLHLSSDYHDQDANLIADAPTDLTQCINPVELNFSYIASSDGEANQETWQELMAVLAKKLERKVNVVSFSDTGEQLRALRNGQLHITALSTGTVPTGVNAHGFVPVCTLGQTDGDYGYTMKIIVPAESDIQKVEDIRGRRMTFTRPRSNSGYKAALVLLMDKHDMQIERDYAWGFSYGHDNSIRRVAAQEFEAAAVASDLLDRMVARGEIGADSIRSIYESEKFPPGAIGYAYNLMPELREGIREVLLSFDWKDTSLEKEFGPSGATQFVAISYKDDWGNVRRIDTALAKARQSMNPATP
jgi:phosphonate transport system substrate-binding protein